MIPDGVKDLAAIHGKEPEEQREILLAMGWPDEEIPDFLAYANGQSRPQPVKQVESNTVFTESEVFKAVKARHLKLVKETPETAPRYPELTAFQKHQLHNRFIMGGSTDFDDASYKNPADLDTAVMRWLRDVFHPTGKTIAVLTGDTGPGKTWGALAYMNELAFAEPCRVRMDYYGQAIEASPVKFVTAFDMATMIHHSRREDNAKQLKSCVEKRFLILDEFGAKLPEFHWDDFISHFDALIGERHKYKRPTIITSNMAPHKVAEVAGDRVMSRIRQSGLIYVTKDPDFRDPKNKKG